MGIFFTRRFGVPKDKGADHLVGIIGDQVKEPFDSRFFMGELFLKRGNGLVAVRFER